MSLVTGNLGQGGTALVWASVTWALSSGAWTSVGWCGLLEFSRGPVSQTHTLCVLIVVLHVFWAVLFCFFDSCFFITPWKKRYDKLSVLKSRNITLPTKIYIVKAMILPVVMYRCESWTINKAERQRIDAFELHCWRRLLRFPWTARRSNQSILKEINPEYSLEGLMLKLKRQYFGHFMWKADLLEKTLLLGKIESKKKRVAESEMVR